MGNGQSVRRALGYLRVSTSEQADSGLSLEAQERRIRAYCVANDMELVELHSDVASGGNMDRPELQRALAALKAGEADVLVILRLDRLSRSTRDTLALADRCQKEGWALASLSEKLDTYSPSGRLVLTVLASMAQFEREQTAERTRQALHQKRGRNELVGAVPYGYRLAENGIKLVEVAKEQRVLTRMRRLRRRGVSYGEIASRLTRAKIPTKTGKVKWAPKVVRGILLSRSA